MKNNIVSFILLVISCSLLVVGFLNGCAQEAKVATATTTNTTTTTSPVFSVSPIAPAEINFIIALGWLNPPAHTLPTDHVYFMFGDPDHPPADASKTYPIYAPIDSTIYSVLYQQSEKDYKVAIRVTSNFQYYFDHLKRFDPSIQSQIGSAETSYNDLAIPLTAGQTIGSIGGVVDYYGVDFGAVDSTATQGFLAPSKYYSQTLHAVSPLAYFSEPLKSQLYAKVRRDSADKDGQLNYDVAGTLSGNWFAEGVTLDSSANWANELAFAAHPYYATRKMVSMGGLVGLSNVLALSAEATKPVNVTPASGKIIYSLLAYDPNNPTSPPSVQGRIIVEMLADDRLKAEATTEAITDFTGNAKIFTR